MTDLTPVTRELVLSDGVKVTLEERGSGRPILLLHGGAGPKNLAGFAAALAPTARVLVPTHPGFARTPRPPSLARVADLARLYAELLTQLDLKDVLVVGQSMGGWIAAELAARAPSRLRGIALLNAVGILVEGHPIVDAFALSPVELSALSFHDPGRFRIDFSKFTPDELAAVTAGREALAVYAGNPYMHDPTLLRRLSDLRVPALVIWGESDRVVDLEYGRAWAKALPGARFEPVPKAGHFPHVEQPERVLGLLRDFDTH